jgi:ribonuclease HI
LKEYLSLKLRGYDIVFCWIPSHIGIRRNTQADTAAKQALQLPLRILEFHTQTLKPRLENMLNIYGKLIGMKM